MREQGDRGVPPLCVAASLAASGLFAAIFYLASWLDTSPEYAFAWRVVATLGLGVVLFGNRRGLDTFVEYFLSMTRRWWMPFAFMVFAAIVGLQLWLFAWAPLNGHALDVSLGYLLLPIVLVLIGRLVFKSHVSALQWSAAACAMIAVFVQVVLTQAMSWVTLAVCIAYAIYLTGRKFLKVDHEIAFFAESLALSPLAIVAFTTNAPPGSTKGVIAVVGIAIAGSLGMIAFLRAARMLPVPVFGLLTYVEPVLLFIVALVLGEQLGSVELMVYSLIFVALALLGCDGLLASRGRRKRQL